MEVVSTAAVPSDSRLDHGGGSDYRSASATDGKQSTSKLQFAAQESPLPVIVHPAGGDYLPDVLRHMVLRVFSAEKPGAPSLVETEFDALFEASKGLYFLDERFRSALCNVALNRYPDILPVEQTRVRLNRDDGSGRGDYINASFMSPGLGPSTGGGSDSLAYISTQGPLRETVVDFWRMVLQTRAAAVLMATPLSEGGREKCALYWPDIEKPLVLPNAWGAPLLTVRCELEQRLAADITVRVFAIHQGAPSAGTPPAHRLTHIHYEGWPDHGEPNGADGVWRVLRLLERCVEGATGPLIVHCSAGVGRSGALICLHVLMRRMRDWLQARSAGLPVEEFSPSLFELVLRLRHQRPGMVPDRVQYAFMYKALPVLAERVVHELRFPSPPASLAIGGPGVPGVPGFPAQPPTSPLGSHGSPQRADRQHSSRSSSLLSSSMLFGGLPVTAASMTMPAGLATAAAVAVAVPSMALLTAAPASAAVAGQQLAAAQPLPPYVQPQPQPQPQPAVALPQQMASLSLSIGSPRGSASVGRGLSAAVSGYLQPPGPC